jgi:hypothetical protein
VLYREGTTSLLGLLSNLLLAATGSGHAVLIVAGVMTTGRFGIEGSRRLDAWRRQPHQRGRALDRLPSSADSIF